MPGLIFRLHSLKNAALSECVVQIKVLTLCSNHLTKKVGGDVNDNFDVFRL